MNSFPNNPRCFFRTLPGNKKNTNVILGGGLAGLSSGFILVRAGQPVMVVESDSVVGGLSKTVVKGEFRFNSGGLSAEIQSHSDN